MFHFLIDNKLKQNIVFLKCMHRNFIQESSRLSIHMPKEVQQFLGLT